MSDTDPREVTPDVSEHARLKLLERSNGSRSSVEELWAESVPVGCPAEADVGPRALYHPPTGVLLVYARAEDTRSSYIVKTVLRASYVLEDLNTGHLASCGECGMSYDPGYTGSCPYHGGPA